MASGHHPSHRDLHLHEGHPVCPIPRIQFDLWYCPYPISTFIATQGSITGVIFAILTFVLSAVIWFPFVKAYDDQKVKEETAAIKPDSRKTLTGAA